MSKPNKRKAKPKEDTEVLLRSRRRCCICFGLHRDTSEKRGQIAHLSGKRENNKLDNLAFLCLDHHDTYDSTTSQSKSLQLSEVKAFRNELYSFIENSFNGPGPLRSSSLDDPAVKPREISVVFSDDLSSFEGWQKYVDGEILLSNEYSHTGKYCLKKDSHNDPHGGYKLLGSMINRGFIFSGWIFRPSGDYGGQGDILAIENAEFDGYGFGIAHGIETVAIHKRVRGKYSLICDRYKFKSIIDEWYHFDFHVDEGNRLELCIDNSKGNRLVSIVAENSDFQFFDRVAIHGGHPYYIDNIKVSCV